MPERLSPAHSSPIVECKLHHKLQYSVLKQETVAPRIQVCWSLKIRKVLLLLKLLPQTPPVSLRMPERDDFALSWRVLLSTYHTELMPFQFSEARTFLTMRVMHLLHPEYGA